MENIWGRLKKPQKLNVHLVNSPNDGQTDITKDSIRRKVWDFMEKNDIAHIPRPVHHRIPNFKGASAAGDKVITLGEFHEARNIKVNPDKPQEQVRYRTLEAGKILYVPTPRLAKGLFNRLDSEPKCKKEYLRKMSSRYGIDSLSKPVAMNESLKFDLFVIGSVAVDRFGRRIGKGEGFADLEWAMAASHFSAVTSETIVITTVHDVQVFDELPASLFSSHDLSVDIIVTPTEVIRVPNRIQKPDHIEWNILTREKIGKIAVLKNLISLENKAGKCIMLADGFEDYQQEIDEETQKNRCKGRRDGQNHGQIGIFVGRIPRMARIKELKRSIQERGLLTNKLVWKGAKGYAILYYDKSIHKLSEEEICLKLKDMKLGNSVVTVEPEERKDNGWNVSDINPHIEEYTMSRKPFKIPDRWDKYSSCGEPISDSPFVAFKVPLRSNVFSQQLMDHVPISKEMTWTPENVLERFPNLISVIDLTNTNRYYNPQIFKSVGSNKHCEIKYTKIYTQGHVIPSSTVVQKFFDSVDETMKTQKGGLIGVHCTHGVNRTGYLICRYLIEKLNWKPNDAIKAFAKHRGHPIERINCLNDLLKGSWVKLN